MKRKKHKKHRKIPRLPQQEKKGRAAAAAAVGAIAENQARQPQLRPTSLRNPPERVVVYQPLFSAKHPSLRNRASLAEVPRRRPLLSPSAIRGDQASRRAMAILDFPLGSILWKCSCAG